MVRFAVETRFTKFWVETKLFRFAVDTKLTKLAVETKLARLGVETTPDTLETYPDVPNPLTVEASCVSK